jgi:endoglucanase
MFTKMPEGGEYPVEVHTAPYVLLNMQVPGGLVDGPVYTSIYNNLLGLRLLKPDVFAQFQNEHVVYHDDVGDYSTNEPTMDGTAGSILMMTYFSKGK